MDTLELQIQILQEIEIRGLVEGIDLYEKNRAHYDSLPLEKASLLWRELLTAIERKGGVKKALSMMRRDDPFQGLDLNKLSVGQVMEINEYRQQPKLDGSTVSYMMQVYRGNHLFLEKSRLSD